LEACIPNILSKFQSVYSLNFELKKEQETAVKLKGLLMGRDVLAVLPTGYGKSFIFQTYVMAGKQANKQRHKRFDPV